MKKNIGNISTIISFFIIFTLISGAISFAVFSYRQKNNEKAQKLAYEKANGQADLVEDKLELDQLFENPKEIFLESYLGPNDIIELSVQDVEAISRFLDENHLNLVMVGEIKENGYLYSIHIKNKNIKIKVSEEYIIMDNLQSSSQIFKMDIEELHKFTEELESIYMKKYSTTEISQEMQQLRVEAKDEGKEWVLDTTEGKKLQSYISLKAPISLDLAMGVSSVYPDYVLKMKGTQKDFNIRLLNKEILAIDTSDSITYYKYDEKLWDYINKEFAIKLKAEPHELKYLLKSKKIIVDSADGIWDLEDESYYPREIIRGILKAEKNKIDEPILGEILWFTLTFTIDGKTKEIKVYDNYFVYDEKEIYESKKIGEIVKSILSVP